MRNAHIPKDADMRYTEKTF